MTQEARDALDEVFDEAIAACPYCREKPRLRCLVPNPNGVTECTRAAGHEGEHWGCGLLEHPLERWPQSN